jgi:hypothetical protein
MFLEKQDKAEGVSDYNNFFVPTHSDKNKVILSFQRITMEAACMNEEIMNDTY